MDDDDIEKERLAEAIRNGDAEMEGFAIAEAPGKAFIEFIKDVEGKCKELKSQSKETRDNMNIVMASAIEIAHAMFNMHYYCLPFHHMHKNQNFTPGLFDDVAKNKIALISADLVTIKTVSKELAGTMEELRKHMDPVFKKMRADQARKETLDTGVATAEAPTTNVIDFEERRGQKRKETLH